MSRLLFRQAHQPLTTAEIIASLRKIIQHEPQAVLIDREEMPGIPAECEAYLLGKWVYIFEQGYTDEFTVLRTVIAPDGRRATDFKDDPLAQLDDELLLTLDRMLESAV